MANILVIIRSGAVGFIAWLDELPPQYHPRLYIDEFIGRNLNDFIAVFVRDLVTFPAIDVFGN